MRITAILFALVLSISPLYADVPPEDNTAPKAISEDTTATKNVTEVYAGQEITFNLKSDRSSGYEWQLADQLDPAFIELVDTKFTEPNAELGEKQGTEVWRFKAIKPGEAVISLRYAKPTSEDAPAWTKASFSVLIKEKPESAGAALADATGTNVVTGKVSSLEFAIDFVRTNPYITIVDDNGNSMQFVVRPMTPIYDSSMKLYSLREVAQNDQVRINYRTAKNGALEATAIKLSSK